MSNRQHQASQQPTTVAPQSTITLPPVIGNVATPALTAAAITKSKFDFVQVDALVLLKILKHCQEMGGGAEQAQGILTGMVQTQDNVKRIEITNCFGLPNINNLKSVDYDEVCNTLITDNLKTFRHLNIDHLIVGWYQSSLFGNFVNKNFIEDHFMYQTIIDESIVLIYDPFKSQHGSLFFKAYHLTPNMMELQKRKDFSPEAMKELKLNHDNFMEELPLVVKNSHLVSLILLSKIN
jgi:translation initiation factor 3 subunit H